MIRTHDESGCRTIAIDRADKANALTEDMLNTMAQAVEGCTEPVLVLTGQGRVFSAGADLDDVRNGTLATSPAWERLSAAVAGFEGLSIAALNGSCAGGAMGMMLACDLRVAVPGARFFYPVIKMGVLPQPSDPGRLAALCGAAFAKRLLLTGAKVSAAEALATGLIDAVAEDVTNTVTEWATPARAADPVQIADIKRMIGR